MWWIVVKQFGKWEWLRAYGTREEAEPSLWAWREAGYQARIDYR